MPLSIEMGASAGPRCRRRPHRGRTLDPPVKQPSRSDGDLALGVGSALGLPTPRGPTPPIDRRCIGRLVCCCYRPISCAARRACCHAERRPRQPATPRRHAEQLRSVGDGATSAIIGVCHLVCHLTACRGAARLRGAREGASWEPGVEGAAARVMMREIQAFLHTRRQQSAGWASPGVPACRRGSTIAKCREHFRQQSYPTFPGARSRRWASSHKRKTPDAGTCMEATKIEHTRCAFEHFPARHDNQTKKTRKSPTKSSSSGTISHPDEVSNQATGSMQAAATDTDAWPARTANPNRKFWLCLCRLPCTHAPAAAAGPWHALPTPRCPSAVPVRLCPCYYCYRQAWLHPATLVLPHLTLASSPTFAECDTSTTCSIRCLQCGHSLGGRTNSR